ncbi:MAG: hypothetical protein LBJ83_03125, partial [Oscillospiraceae bacterium]|nr:hypothetical protein [Oscillospiraceae bacterium]
MINSIKELEDKYALVKIKNLQFEIKMICHQPFLICTPMLSRKLIKLFGKKFGDVPPAKINLLQTLKNENAPETTQPMVNNITTNNISYVTHNYDLSHVTQEIIQQFKKKTIDIANKYDLWSRKEKQQDHKKLMQTLRVESALKSETEKYKITLNNLHLLESNEHTEQIAIREKIIEQLTEKHMELQQKVNFVLSESKNANTFKEQHVKLVNTVLEVLSLCGTETNIIKELRSMCRNNKSILVKIKEAEMQTTNKIEQVRLLMQNTDVTSIEIKKNLFSVISGITEAEITNLQIQREIEREYKEYTVGTHKLSTKDVNRQFLKKLSNINKGKSLDVHHTATTNILSNTHIHEQLKSFLDSIENKTSNISKGKSLDVHHTATTNILSNTHIHEQLKLFLDSIENKTSNISKGKSLDVHHTATTNILSNTHIHEQLK